MKHIIPIFVIVFLFAAPAYAGVSKNISYGELKAQALDIYAPENAKDAPVMIFVHGGGWHIGNKSNVHSKPKAFNDEGYIFVSVGYPLLPDYGVGVQATSIAKATAWVYENIERYGGNAKQIHIMGHSAGAHLVALIATDESYLKNAGYSAKVLQSVISVDGAALNIPWRMKDAEDGGRFSERMFSNAFGKDEKRWKALSPYHHLTSGNYVPPFLFLTAHDRTASNVVAEGFKDKVDDLGVRAKHVKIANRNHATINRKMGRYEDKAFEAILEFIK